MFGSMGPSMNTSSLEHLTWRTILRIQGNRERLGSGYMQTNGSVRFQDVLRNRNTVKSTYRRTGGGWPGSDDLVLLPEVLLQVKDLAAQLSHLLAQLQDTVVLCGQQIPARTKKDYRRWYEFALTNDSPYKWCTESATPRINDTRSRIFPAS